MNMFITVRTQFPFLHKYENAPEQVEYLKALHRHLMYVRCTIEVFHDDRELEFIVVKTDIDKFIQDCLTTNKWGETSSCEQLARTIVDFVLSKYGGNRKISVSVTEDDENGAIIKNY